MKRLTVEEGSFLAILAQDVINPQASESQLETILSHLTGDSLDIAQALLGDNSKSPEILEVSSSMLQWARNLGPGRTCRKYKDA